MFVDASALIAILLREPEADDLSERLQAAARCYTSPVAVFETVAAIMRKLAASYLVADNHVQALLTTADIAVIPITDEIGRAALLAFDRYGKGRGHPAQLNMGDCFAYACARVLGAPLLYKGDDFSRTDLAYEKS